MINSRSKGQRGEREVADLLFGVIKTRVQEHGFDLDAGLDHLGVAPPRRNLAQSYKGGYDLITLPGLCVEVKFHEAPYSAQWWEQTKRQAVDGEPILFYRRSRVPWRVRMFGALRIEATGKTVRCPVDIEVESFLLWFGELVGERLKRPQ